MARFLNDGSKAFGEFNHQIIAECLAELGPSFTDEDTVRVERAVSASLADLPGVLAVGAKAFRLLGAPALIGLFHSNSARLAERLPLVSEYVRLIRSLTTVNALELVAMDSGSE